tara:strand:+ start:737 stop:1162 length:426 start_codon:yes stop_codon:yes gene_type:complete
MFHLFKSKQPNLRKIVSEEFSRMPTLHDERDTIHIMDFRLIRVDYYSFRDPGTFYFFMLNLKDTPVKPTAPKTAYHRQIDVNTQDRGYGRELVEAGERIFGRLGITSIQVNDPFDSPGVWNQNPTFWNHMGYIEGVKELKL